MSAVTQVESAIEQLSAEDQRQLLQWLLSRCVTTAAPASGDGRVIWIGRLAQLRARLATGKLGPSAEQLLNEDRGE